MRVLLFSTCIMLYDLVFCVFDYVGLLLIIVCCLLVIIVQHVIIDVYCAPTGPARRARLFSAVRIIFVVTNGIGTPDPQLEPQITSLDKCKMN